MDSKLDLNFVVMEGMTMVPKNVNISFTAGATTMSPFSTYSSLLMPKAW